MNHDVGGAVSGLRWQLLGAGLLSLAAFVAAGRGAELEVRFEGAAREVVIATGALEPGGYELRLVTPGITTIETGAEVGEPGIIYLPPRSGGVRLDQKIATEGAENYFFFHSLGPARDWALVAHFPADAVAGGTWKLNGRFSPRGGELTGEIVLPFHELEPGENLLHVAHPRPPRPTWYYRHRFTLSGSTGMRVRLPVATSTWAGDVALHRSSSGAADTDVLARGRVERAQPQRRPSVVPERWWEDRAGIREAAFATGRNVLAAQIRDPRSFFSGGFHLVYDTRQESYRMSHWLWAWGPTIALLLELEKRSTADPAFAARCREAALAAGKRSLQFEVEDPRHPAAAVSTVRWEPSRAVPGGWVEYISTADSLFLAGWGWMPLYRMSGEPVYRERTERLVAAAERLMREYPVVPQDWVVQRERWTPHTLDESVFGMIGFRELYASTRSPGVADAGERFLESHLAEMGRSDGLLERAWLREEDRAIWNPDIKGHAWVVEGYLDAHALTGKPRFLELAQRLATRVLECQSDDGAWGYAFKQAGPAEPRDDKGTAIWAYMLYRMYRQTGDAAYLAAARQATAWCLRQQYRGDHAELDGGLLNTNAMAYVRRRPMTILYSTTFFGLALLEELALGERE